MLTLILAFCAAEARGQFFVSPSPSAEPPSSAMTIVPPGRETLQILAQSREALKQGRTGDAFDLLQRVIDLPEDFFTDKSMRQTLKSDALQILAGLSPAEREAYELVHGAVARGLLAEALTAGDSERLAEVMRRFPYTQAGLEAAERMALEAWDHGRVFQAAILLSQVRSRPALSPERSRRIALWEAFAWHQAGDSARGARLLADVTSQIDAPSMRIGGQRLPKFSDAMQAEQWLKRVAGPSSPLGEAHAGEWIIVRGSASGTAASRETGPMGGPIWHASPLADLEADLPPKKFGPPGSVLPQLVELAESPLKEAERAIWTTLAPLAVGETIVFRTPRDIVALDRRTGAVRWRSTLTVPEFDQLWKELNNVGPDAGLTEFLRQVVFEDSNYGSLSSDGELVFALDGQNHLILPSGNRLNNARILFQDSDVELPSHNRLTAYELAGGRLAWEIGGDRAETAGEFAGHFFLGPPLAAEGKLFILAEVQGEVRLVVFETRPQGAKKIWSQPLVIPALDIVRSPERRQAALIPASAQGIIVCPTGTGAVIAVDFASRRLSWSYSYPSSQLDFAPAAHPLAALNAARMNRRAAVETDDTGWVDGNPIVADGRVFVTPTDSDELHCLNLTDGSRLWTAPRDRGVYLAGADAERVVIVGSERIDALRSADGSPLWTVHIPPPSGRGVWMADRYLLPLSTGEIASLDLATGRLLARSKLPNGWTPGNLAAAAGALVSISVRDVFGFRSVDDLDAEIARRLAADSQDAAALAWRGEQRLHRGEFQAGLDDLRTAIAREPSAYAKSVLAAALLEGLRTDFPRYRDTVSELDALADDPQQRQEFLWLVARGLQHGGEPIAAFERMLHLVDASLDDFAWESFGSPWQTRNDRKLAGLFETIYRHASDADRKVLDRMILARLPADFESLFASDATAGLRRYLRVFGFHPSSIAARRKLAESLDPETDAVEFVREWTRLSSASDPAIAGPAAGVLARWFLARRRFDAADLWINRLDERFPDVTCAPDLTGRDMASRLRDEPEYVAYRESPRPWPAGEIEYKRSSRPINDGPMVRAVVVGPLPEHYQGWSFETDQRGQVLVARDDQARQRWRLTRGISRPEDQFLSAGPQRVTFHDRLVGWSNGHRLLIAADVEPERNPPRILWEESLAPTPLSSGNGVVAIPAPQRRIVVNRGAGIVFRQDALPGTTGVLAAITDSAVIYHNGRKLFAADPLTGRLLWSRKDLPRIPFQVAADDQVVAVAGLSHPLAPALGSVTLLRTSNGEQIGTVDAPVGVIEWIGGGRVLRSEDPSRPSTGPMPLELYDLVRGETIWKTELARPAAIRVWNQSEVFALEENRRLTVRSATDGAVRWTQELSLEVAAEALFVQPWKDRYLIVVGSTSPPPAQPGSARVVGFDNHHVPINGHVAALNRRSGEILWTHRVEDTAFDTSQPAGWPILLFAGRMYITPRAPAAPLPSYLTTTLFDKQTGKLIISVEEPSNIGTYFVDADPDRNRISVNFLTWSGDMRYTGRKE